MTYSVFMFFLRCLVLLGLCSVNSVFAATEYSTYPDWFSTHRAACERWISVQNIGSGASNPLVYSTSNSSLCTATRTSTGAVVTTNIDTRCTASTSQYDFTVGVGGGLTSLLADAAAVLDTDPLPAPQCVDSCVLTLTPNGSLFLNSYQASLGGGDPFFSFNKQPVTAKYSGSTCVMPPPCAAGTLAGANGTCIPDPQYCPPPNAKDVNGVCKPPLPICVPPQVLNQQLICETPMCPVGQVRTTASSACAPIVCTPPLVKEGNFCVLPKCGTGESYEYRDGIGQCVKNDPVCIPPQTLVNGICKTPTCGAGMILSAAGSCIPDPTINPNTKGSTGQSGTGTGTSGTGTGGVTGTGNGSGTTGTVTGTSPTGSGTGSTATSGGGGTGGTSTNTGGAGLCTTPPCGNCDPATETCGDTFGGSCKSGFTCNGDAIQCAVAQATNKAECDLKSIYIDTEIDSAFIEGKAIFEGGTKAFGEAGGLTATNGSILINSTNPYASSCPADVQLFEYKGSSYKLPLSNYCNIFQIMGNIMLLAASLIALKIIMKVD